MNWYLRACPVCKGDCHDDPYEGSGVIYCWLCGRSFDRKTLAPTGHRDPSTLSRPGPKPLEAQAADHAQDLGVSGP